VPAYLKLDQTDNLLNPTTGYGAQLAVTPAHTFSGSNLTFVTNLISGSTYWQVGSEERAILAGRAALGSVDGAAIAHRLWLGQLLAQAANLPFARDRGGLILTSARPLFFGKSQ
jgi:hypothetical protein